MQQIHIFICPRVHVMPLLPIYLSPTTPTLVSIRGIQTTRITPKSSHPQLFIYFRQNDVNTEKVHHHLTRSSKSHSLAPLVRLTLHIFLLYTDGNLVLGRAFCKQPFTVCTGRRNIGLSQAPGPDDSFIKNLVNIEAHYDYHWGDSGWLGRYWASYWTPPLQSCWQQF